MQNFKVELMSFVKKTGMELYVGLNQSRDKLYTRKSIEEIFRKIQLLPSNGLLFQPNSFEMNEEEGRITISAVSNLENFGGQLTIPEFEIRGINSKTTWSKM